ncbi:PAS domain S-box protein [Arenibacter aquaticus]|uniref:histidine kinase n=1 Tax=Arenibacter aquaticus TaxID=2489054 RepID=A0A430K334_9FLAO|nr:PAS domain S-box protein [Arenibacter aquaticus]RTE53324.1 PAS domain S-box protein [Arenibacter aquaticus]
MESKEVTLLKKALERQKKARIQAEKILEAKSHELYNTVHHLKQENSKLQHLLDEKISELDGAFINIIDPYVVMDLKANVINMNNSAKEFLGYDHTKNKINLSKLVHQDDLEYTIKSFNFLLEVGTLKNYKAKIILKDKTEKHVQINANLIYDPNGKPIAAQGIIRDVSQETEIKQLLAEQKKQQDIIVENSPLGIVLSVEGNIVKANPSFSRLMGYTQKELKNLTVNDISATYNTQEADQFLKKMKSGELDSFTVTKQYIRKDGSLLHAKTNVSAVRNFKGEVEFQVAIIEDISKELEAEEQLKASENRLSTLILNLQTGVLLENEDRKIALTNQLFCDLFQIPATPEQLVGVDCEAAAEQNKVHFKKPKAFVQRIEEILKEQKMVVSDELEMVDGRILERDYIPIFNNGKYKGHLWTYQDVTLRRNYKRTLEAQREKYSSIIANMNLGLIEVDNDDVIQMVNQSFCNMSSYTKKELLGQKAIDIIKVTDHNIINDKNKKRQQGKSDSYEIEIVDKNGTVKHWLVSGAPRYDEAGSIVGSIGIHLDITQQKHLQLQKEKLLRELETSNRGLQEYAHIVSHDLKSPLRSISALASWMKEDYQEVLDGNGLNQLQMMQEKIEGMDKLIDGILNYSSINSDNLKTERVDLNIVIQEIREIIFIPDHVKVVIMNTLPVLETDKTKMHQLFQNLIGNAVMHITNTEGLVKVSSTETSTHWQFSIEDNGIGIPKEYHEKIFKIFQSIGEGERSTGIGLSIVKKIVDLYEGDIWLNSEKDKGTTFFFTLKKTT